MSQANVCGSCLDAQKVSQQLQTYGTDTIYFKWNSINANLIKSLSKYSNRYIDIETYQKYYKRSA